jgi:hypothetical protein
MKATFRLSVALIVFLATYLFVFWMPISLPLDRNLLIRNLVSLIAGCIAAWYIWKKTALMQDRAMTCIFSGAGMVGGIGFVLGFFGPIIFMPGANQGPLLGIFITGPLGFILGGIGGGVYWLLRRQTGSTFRVVASMFMWLLWTGGAAAIVFVIATFTYVPWRESKFSSDVNTASDLEKRDASLTSLSVRFLSDSELIRLGKFKNLNHLDFGRGCGIGEAKITDAGLQAISQLDLPELKWLMLGYCTKITDAGLPHVARMKHLKNLSLSGCPQITDSGLEKLVALTALERLDVRGCIKITNHGLLCLADMKGLREVLLGGCTAVTPQGIEKAKQVLPDCKIEKNDAEWAAENKYSHRQNGS